MKKSINDILAFHEKIAAISATTADLNKLLNILISMILKLVAASSGSIMIHDPSENRLRLFYSTKHPGAALGESPRSGSTLPADHGIAGKVFQSGKPLLINDIPEKSRHPGAFQVQPSGLPREALSTPSADDMSRALQGLTLRRKASGGSFLSLPLQIAGHTVGILNLNRTTGQPGFTKDDLSLLETLKGQIAAIVEKARLLDDLKEQKEEIQSLYSLTTILFGSQEMKPSLISFLDLLSKKLEIERSAIIVLTESESKIFSVAGKQKHSGADKPEFDVLASKSMSKPDLEKLLLSITKQLQSDLAKPWVPERDDPQLQPPVSLPYFEKGKAMEILCLPISAGRRVRHFLFTSMRRNLRDREAVRRHYKFLHLITQQLSVALEREEMLDKIKRDQEILADNAYQNSIFLEIGKDLASTLDPHNVLRKAFEQFGKLISFSSTAILMFDDLDNSYRILFQPSHPVLPSYTRRLKTEIIRLFREFPATPMIGNPNIVPVEVLSPQNPSGKPLARFKHAIHLPIILVDKVVGLIHLAKDDPEPFTQSDLDITTQFTAIFLTSIKNALIHKQTEKLAFTDPLTGLYNHRYFQETLKQEFVRSRRYQKPLSLMIIDIDHFKRFNDNFGHLVGDKVLIYVGKIFENSVRERIDTVARYGGEEFGVLIPETPLSGAKNLAERIRSAVESEPMRDEASELRVTVSIGVACTTKTHCEKQSDLIQAADTALYKAKDNGRNQVRIYELEHV